MNTETFIVGFHENDARWGGDKGGEWDETHENKRFGFNWIQLNGAASAYFQSPFPPFFCVSIRTWTMFFNYFPPHVFGSLNWKKKVFSTIISAEWHKIQWRLKVSASSFHTRFYDSITQLWSEFERGNGWGSKWNYSKRRFSNLVCTRWKDFSDKGRRRM